MVKSMIFLNVLFIPNLKATILRMGNRDGKGCKITLKYDSSQFIISVKAYWALRPTLSSLLSPLSISSLSLLSIYLLLAHVNVPSNPIFFVSSLLSCFLTWYQSFAAAAVSDRKLRVCPKTPPPSSAAVLICDVAVISQIRWYRLAVGLRIDLRTSCGRRRPALSCDAVALLRSRPARWRPARPARRRPARPARRRPARPSRSASARPARRCPARPCSPCSPCSLCSSASCSPCSPCLPCSPAKRRRLALLVLLASALLALLPVALTH